MKEFNPKAFRRDVVGLNQRVPSLGKKRLRYINFDNAASTPPLKPVVKKMETLLNWYSGVHRGTGYKSLVASKVYDDSHNIIAQFINADMDKNIVVLVKNTTEAINKLSYRLNLNPRDVVVSTAMEHHSNDLPWRQKAKVQYARVDNQGCLDMADLEALLKAYYPRVKLVTVCGASNVTGHLNDIHQIAELSHAYKARILVDAAQLLPHHPVDVKPDGDPQHIDYLAFSGHKIYAPFGTGVLFGPRDTFLASHPEYSGGGTVSMVTTKRVFWGELPDREEAGSPNVVGAFALAETLKYLGNYGMEQISAYENNLLQYAYHKISQVPGITLYGVLPRVGVISFNLEGITHSLLGAILCFEAGIGVRTGCFCAQPYVRNLLGEKENLSHLNLYNEKQTSQLPGMVRVSLAAYNTCEEIDYLVNFLDNIARNKFYFKRNYLFSPGYGGYIPRDFKNDPGLDVLGYG